MRLINICIVSILLTAFYLLLSVTISNILFPKTANGSLIKFQNKTIGSELIGQNFNSTYNFHNRPSLNNYKNDISGNSNYPYYSSELLKEIKENEKRFIETNLNNKPDLNIISQSASGLDPHITYEAAISQSERISRSTGITKRELTNIINTKSKPIIFSLFGKKIINVLELNLEIKDIYAKTTRS